LFVKWFVDHLSPTGRAGVIVPSGVLFGGNRAAVKVRELLLNEYGLQAVINMPSGVFKPYSGVGTAVLVLDRRYANRSSESYIWFYDLTEDGFSLDDKRTPIEANDIPDVLAKWSERIVGPNSYHVSLAKILESDDLSLAAGHYRPAIALATKHEAPKEILKEVVELEISITDAARKLLGEIEK
jgi:type I restriction enzyme M protein